MEYFGVWCPDMGEDQSDARNIKAFDAEMAACEYVEHSYHEEAFDCEMIVHVLDNSLHPSIWALMPEPDITFYSREVKG